MATSGGRCVNVHVKTNGREGDLRLSGPITRLAIRIDAPWELLINRPQHPPGSPTAAPGRPARVHPTSATTRQAREKSPNVL